MDENHLFNGQTWGNLLLPSPNNTDPSLNEFEQEAFKRYLKYVTFQAGLDGMFTVKTPKQIVEGYPDNLVYSLSQQPVYKGGDQTQDPVLSVDQGVTNPRDNEVAYLSGDTSQGNEKDDDKSYLFTR